MELDLDEAQQYAVQRMLEGWKEFFWNAFTALAFNDISGDYAEFGSFGGTTMWLAHQQIEAATVDRHMWAFDSFQGLPPPTALQDDHPAWLRGSMGMSVDRFRASCDERGLPRDSYTTVEGFFADTLPGLGATGEPTDIALAYVDCDMYSSTKSVLEFLRPRLKHGMIVAFDDYYCWSATGVSGERAALRELLAEEPSWNFHRYREIGWAGTSFVVERNEGELRAEELAGRA